MTAALGTAAVAFDRPERSRRAGGAAVRLRRPSARGAARRRGGARRRRCACRGPLDDCHRCAARLPVEQGAPLGGRVAGAGPAVAAGRTARGWGQGGAEAQRQACSRPGRPRARASGARLWIWRSPCWRRARASPARRTSSPTPAKRSNPSRSRRAGYGHHAHHTAAGRRPEAAPPAARPSLRRHDAAACLRSSLGRRRACADGAAVLPHGRRGLVLCRLAEASWATVVTPNGTAWAAHDVVCFGSVNLALAGDGHVAVSRDAGRTGRPTYPAVMPAQRSPTSPSPPRGTACSPPAGSFS